MTDTRPRKLWARACVRAGMGVLLYLLPGCVGANPPRNARMAQQPRAKDPPYAWGFCNATGNPFDNVHIDYVVGGVPETDGPGRLSSSNTGGAQSMFAPGPIPQGVTVSWRDNGRLLREDVEVASKIANPSAFKGTIWFKFLPTGTVAVIPMTEAEMRERARRGEDYAPN